MKVFWAGVIMLLLCASTVWREQDGVAAAFKDCPPCSVIEGSTDGTHFVGLMLVKRLEGTNRLDLSFVQPCLQKMEFWRVRPCNPEKDGL